MQTQERAWLAAVEKWPLKEGQLVAVSPSFGIAELLIVRIPLKVPQWSFCIQALFLQLVFTLSMVFGPL